jgi:subtilisin family serine protease
MRFFNKIMPPLALAFGVLVSQSGSAQTASNPTWKKIANENQSFAIAGAKKTVRYGARTNWVSKVISGNAVCSNAFFGKDPIKGVAKTCEEQIATAASTQVVSHPNYGTLWNHQQIQLNSALGLLTNKNPQKKILIAVIDAGHSNHPDITLAKINNQNLAFSTHTADPSPIQGINYYKHGAHVMGVINGQNSRGQYGICPKDICEIISIKTDIADVKSVERAIELAIQYKADVINMSFNYAEAYHQNIGCPKTDTDNNGSNPYGIALAIDKALAGGIVIINSAGNYLKDVEGAISNLNPRHDVKTEFISNCPGVISVGASTHNSKGLAPYSNFGSQLKDSNGALVYTKQNNRPISTLTLIAPGGGVMDNWNGNPHYTSLLSLFGAEIECLTNSEYTGTAGVYSAHFEDATQKYCHRYASGTSFSAPHVAAVVGMMQAERAALSLPKLSPKDIKEILMSTATDLSSEPSCQPLGFCGSGLLNANEALRLTKTYMVTPPPPTVNGPCSYAPAGTSCKIDAIAYDTNTSNFSEETVIAYGKMWKFNAAGTPTMAAKDLMTIPQYANGPCSLATAQPCIIDSLTILNHPIYGYIESVTAYGYTWAFRRDGSFIEWANNIFLNSVSRYHMEAFFRGSPPPIKPCQLSPYNACKFATRTLLDMTPESGIVVESITADGYYFLYDWAGNLISKNTLLNVPRYANGPCQYRPTNSVCTFDSLDNKRVNGKIIETITAYGRYWEFDTSNSANTAPINGTGGLLNVIARFK